MKPVVLSLHVRAKMTERPVSEAEIVEAITQSPWRPARGGRYRTTRWYPFGQTYRGTFYAGKDVQPVFVEEPDRLVVVTVLVFLNQREEG